MSIGDWVGLVTVILLGLALLALTVALLVSALSTKYDPIERLAQRVENWGRK